MSYFAPFSYAVLVFVRALGMLCFLPIAPEGVFRTQRLALACGMAIFFARWGTGVQLSAASICSELLVGAVAALPFLVLVNAFGICAELFDSMRGAAMGVIYDPLSETPQPLSGVFGRSAAVACFVFAGGFEQLFRTFASSLNTYQPEAAVVLSPGLARRSLYFLTEELSSNLAFFVPMAALMLSVEAGSVFITKLVPGVSLQSECFQIKSIAGLLAFYLFWRSGASYSIRPFLEGAQFL